ncbi:transcriptional regulator [Leucobacter zeae]|nr:transcriptional regulator [Leucobacter zeae]
MELPSDVGAIAALSDPVRRDLYEFVASCAQPIGREAAAAAVGISAHQAKFHLERLVAAGLLDTEFRRLSGRSGPGAGRPAKLYRRTDDEFLVALPERRYDLAGGILASAIERAATGLALEDAVSESAFAAGAAAATAAAGAARHDGVSGAASDGTPEGADPGAVARAARVLATAGYEPEVVAATEATDAAEAVRLRNCPFDRLAQEHTDLICGANRHFVQGMLDCSGCTGLHARLDPQPGYCCVSVRTGGAADER